MYEGVPLRDIIFKNVFRILALNYQLFVTSPQAFRGEFFCIVLWRQNFQEIMVENCVRNS